MQQLDDNYPAWTGCDGDAPMRLERAIMYSLDLHLVVEEQRKDFERAVRDAQILEAVKAARESRNEHLRTLLFKLGAYLVSLGGRLQIRSDEHAAMPGGPMKEAVALALHDRNEKLSSKR